MHLPADEIRFIDLEDPFCLAAPLYPFPQAFMFRLDLFSHRWASPLPSPIFLFAKSYLFAFWSFFIVFVFGSFFYRAIIFGPILFEFGPFWFGRAKPISLFFLENAGELRFIALEREKGPHTTPFSHTGIKYEWGNYTDSKTLAHSYHTRLNCPRLQTGIFRTKLWGASCSV